MEKLITTKQACETLSLCRNTLYALVAHGRLRAIRVSARKFVFRPSDIQRFIDANLTDGDA